MLSHCRSSCCCLAAAFSSASLILQVLHVSSSSLSSSLCDRSFLAHAYTSATACKLCPCVLTYFRCVLFTLSSSPSCSCVSRSVCVSCSFSWPFLFLREKGILTFSCLLQAYRSFVDKVDVGVGQAGLGGIWYRSGPGATIPGRTLYAFFWNVQYFPWVT